MKKAFAIALAAVVAALSLAAAAATAPGQTTSLTIYSGREQALVKPIMDRFTKETGIELNVRYASSTALATALVEEGRNSPADIYWSQEPGMLGLVGARGLLVRLPQATVGKVPSRFSTPSRRWVGTSGRSRVLVYNTNELQTSELPHVGLGSDEPTLEGQDRRRAHERVVPGVPRRHDQPLRRGARSHLARGAAGRTTCASTRTTRPSCRRSAAATSRSGS